MKDQLSLQATTGDCSGYSKLCRIHASILFSARTGGSAADRSSARSADRAISAGRDAHRADDESGRLNRLQHRPSHPLAAGMPHHVLLKTWDNTDLACGSPFVVYRRPYSCTPAQIPRLFLLLWTS